MSLDERLLRLARRRGHTAAAEHAVRRFSSLGEHAAVWIAIGVGGSLLASRSAQQADARPSRKRADRGDWRRATAAVAGTYALNTAIKLAVKRARPELPGLPPLARTPTRLGFPSAHASTSFAAALSYSRLGVPAVPLYGLAGALAASRLYLGLHYPSDVLAGALLGSVVASACVPRPA